MVGRKQSTNRRSNSIRYGQVWEDADVLVRALRLKPTDTVVSIASGGDNTFALLAAGCGNVIAVDRNPAQLACVRIRAAAYGTLKHSDFLELYGARSSTRRGELLDRLSDALSVDDLEFWESRRHLIEQFGIGGTGSFERYFRILRHWVLPFIHNRETIDDVFRSRTKSERAEFYDQHWNVWGWRMMLKVFFSRSVTKRLRDDRSFLDELERSPLEHVEALARKALIEQDPSKNPYLHWIVRGRHSDALPMALREENYQTIRDGLDRLTIIQGGVEDLAEQGVRADAFNLSDIFEYVSPTRHAYIYGQILAAAKPGARMAYWNVLAPRSAPNIHSTQVKRQGALEATLNPLDRACFYSSIVIEDVPVDRDAVDTELN